MSLLGTLRRGIGAKAHGGGPAHHGPGSGSNEHGSAAGEGADRSTSLSLAEAPAGHGVCGTTHPEPWDVVRLHGFDLSVGWADLYRPA